MKTVIFLFCTIVLGFTPKEGFSQKAKIRIKADVSLSMDEVFDLVRNQTDYTFVYNSDLFKNSPKIDLKKGVIKVIKLLDRSSALSNFIYEFTNDNTIILKKKPIVEIEEPVEIIQQTITGIVKDKEGNPIPGVNVLVGAKGSSTKRGVATDFDGKYSIDAAAGEVITFSYIGFQSQKFTIDSQMEINVVLLEEVGDLDEVVVYASGYTKISKERATGSYEVIGSKQLENLPVTEISGALEGLAAGVQVVSDAEGNIRNVDIRGRSTIDSNEKPLVVVDGFAIEGDFSTINPNDVDNITILKDAAAASIWGARAGNGVIVVTTKQNRRDKLRVSVESFIKVGEIMDLDYLIPSADNKTTLEYQKWVSDNDYGTSSGTPGTLATAYMYYNHANQAYLDYQNNEITKVDLDNIISRLESTNFKDDINKYLIQNPFTLQNNISIGGGGERSSYNLSVLHNNYKGSMVGNEREKLLINFRNNFDVTKWLSLDFSIMTETGKNGPNGVSSNYIAKWLSPYQNLVNEDGTFASVITTVHNQRFIDEFSSKITGLPYYNWRYNPYQEALHTEKRNKSWNNRIQAGLNLRILDGLVYRPSFQFEKFSSKNKTLYGEETYYVRDLVNDNVEYDSDTRTVTRTYVPKGAILDKSFSDLYTYTFRNQLNFDKVIDIHEVNVALGGETTWRNTEIYRDRVYGYDDDKLSYVEPPYGSGTGVTWNRLTYPSVSEVPEIDPRLWDNRFVHLSDRFFSIYGNLAYTYDQKYTLTGSYRTDASNLIVDDPKYRYSPLWSAGASWNIKRESFLENNELFNRLLARVTYGVNGNMITTSSTVALINPSNTPSPATGSPFATVSDKGNPALRWEKTYQFNMGVDFSMLNRTFFGSINYYNNHSKELLAEISLPSTYGSTQQSFNAAELRNNGVELDLNYHLKSGQDFSWTTGLKLSTNKSKVLSLNIDQINPYGMLEGGGWYDYSNYIEGYSYGPVFAWVYGGVNDDEDPIVIHNSDPNIEYTMNEDPRSNSEYGPDVLRYMGSSIAPTVAGWTNTFKYKNFTLQAIMVGKFGHVFRRQSFDYQASPQDLGNFHKDLETIMAGNAESLGLPPIPEEYNQDFPFWRFYTSNLNSLVEDASHIRLREVYLSYELPGELLSKIRIDRLKLFVHAQNLGLLWKANEYGLDPEYVNGFLQRPNIRGLDPEYVRTGFSQKPVKTFTFGVSFDF